MYFTDEFSIDNIMLDVPEYRVDNPVRALYQDQDQTLWIGTKGGGILKMFDFHPDMETLPRAERILASNSPLMDNSVYSFAPSGGNSYGLERRADLITTPIHKSGCRNFRSWQMARW